MKMTQKGQVTIPKPLRDLYGLEHNAEVSFRAVQEGVLVYSAAAAKRDAHERAFARARGIAKRGRSTDDILRMTRGEPE